MAVTKIHAINATVGRAIDYICNPHKTDDNVLVTTFACGRETAKYDFKFALGKTKSHDRNIAYHLIPAFREGQICKGQGQYSWTGLHQGKDKRTDRGKLSLSHPEEPSG